LKKKEARVSFCVFRASSVKIFQKRRDFEKALERIRRSRYDYDVARRRAFSVKKFVSCEESTL